MKYWLGIVLLLISSISWAAIGSVVDVKGTACSIERGKQKLPGDKGVGIESMDTYITGSCIANITFKDDTKVKVTENSRLLIDDFIFDPKQSDAGKLALKVGMGTVRYASGQIAKNNPQKVDIKTPTATIAVRGTDFNMTVDEAGQSLIILVPSCKENEKIKQYELEENQCKVGKIDVTTIAGTVSLDKAFEATYVTSANVPPTPPVIINTIEGNIGNTLIIAKPQEVLRASRDNGKSKRELDFEEEQAESNRQIAQRMKQMEDIPPTSILPYTFDNGSKGCNPSTNVCVVFEKQDIPEVQLRGRGVAFRSNPDHYAEVKTQGYDSNTTVNITHDDAPASAIIGSGDVGGNVVHIKQNTGVVKVQ